MRKLVFGEGLLEPTLDGSKRITIRKYREEAHKFKEGEIVLGEFAEGATLLLRITRDTEVYTFDSVPEDHAVADGFGGRDALYEGLRTYYPDLSRSDPAGIVHFEAVTDGNDLLFVRRVDTWPEGDFSHMVKDVGSDDSF